MKKTCPVKLHSKGDDSFIKDYRLVELKLNGIEKDKTVTANPEIGPNINYNIKYWVETFISTTSNINKLTVK